MSKTILYIEDNHDNAVIVKKILERSGYTVQIAIDGSEGMKALAEHQPDLLICDYHLPGLNGSEIVAMIREIEAYEKLPIIMLTADIYTEPSSVASGVNRYLNKPIRRNQLISSIETLLYPTEE